MELIKVTIEKTMTKKEYISKVTNKYHLIEKNVRNIIFKEMLMNTLPLKITIDEEELNEHRIK